MNCSSGWPISSPPIAARPVALPPTSWPRSWLLDLLAASLYESPDLDNFSGRVSDSGEGRWTSIAAIEEGVPTPILTNALYSRFSSRQLDLFADKALSAMRKQFGGHEEKPAQG